MTLRANISGSYDSDALSRLLWPVAWQGTVSTEERADQEAGLRAIVEEAREALRESGGSTVTIRAGRVVEVE